MITWESHGSKVGIFIQNKEEYIGNDIIAISEVSKGDKHCLHLIKINIQGMLKKTVRFRNIFWVL